SAEPPAPAPGAEPGWPSAGAGPDAPLELDTDRRVPPASTPTTAPPTGVGPNAYGGAPPPAGAPPASPYAGAGFAYPGAGDSYGGPTTGGPPAGGAYGGPQMTGATALCAVHPQTPAVGLCPRCGAYMCAWCQRINEFGEIFCATCMERVGYGAPVPWDRRAEIGTWQAWWQTVKEVMMKPDDFFARASHGLSSDPPLLFAMICAWLGAVGTSVVRLAMKEQPGIVAIGLLIGPPIGVLLGVYVWGGIIHLFARMFGGQGSYAASSRNWGFTYSAACLSVVPFLGGMVAFVWEIVLQVYAIKHAHRLTGGKAAAAVLLPVGILLVLCCGGAIALGAAIGGLAASRGGGF
ncbi:MAG TPA: YIP1 family protein, partial [Polyangia bacterium]